MPQQGGAAGKKIVGYKRHITVDTDGRLLMVKLAAPPSPNVPAQAILDPIRKRWPWVAHLFADSADERLKLRTGPYLDIVAESVRPRRKTNTESLQAQWHHIGQLGA
ncbi:transposase [Microvirga mediterraneensis]|uniref:Transposase IS4-like domain-containing protein n=1 Tax=Microvirga mediterraneensis TaxID=2754695 RepID=A0A838BRD2_9HYPH|nr:hypothetical protein [Microvirga mediterraneensis]